MDAIVVDTKQTAMECIQYMKDQRIGTSIFIPLDGIKKKEINERFRSFGSNYRLCVDVIHCDNDITPAVIFAVSFL